MEHQSRRSQRTNLWIIHAALCVGFALLATAVASTRFRTSPLYPADNDVNSDVYVYQLIGNSWAQGFLPYRDVFDIKGPFLLLLFGLSARIRPWSMGPPHALLAILSFAGAWLGYAIARLYDSRRSIAALAAASSIPLISLSAMSVASSFTCEELAIPGVLLMLWLMLRWLRGSETILARWWILDGAVLGALFWSKYLVIVPWVGMFVALIVLCVGGRVPGRDLRRVSILHLIGLGIATVAILPFYSTILPEMVRGYFFAITIDPGALLVAERAFLLDLGSSNIAVALVLGITLLWLVLRVARHRRSEDIALLVAFTMTMVGSLAANVHPNSVFVPLAFVAVVIPQAISSAAAQRELTGRVVALVLAAASVAACVQPAVESVSVYRLLKHRRPLTCYNLSTMKSQKSEKSVTQFFVDAAGHRPILSLGLLFAAKSAYVSKTPMSHPFQMDYFLYTDRMGSNEIQARYLEKRTFAFAWIHVDHLDKFHDLAGQIRDNTYGIGATRAAQRAALMRNYVPVAACNNEILMRAR